MTSCASTGVAAARACVRQPAVRPGQNGAGTGKVVLPVGNVFRPTKWRLDSKAQSCGLSLPTLTRERIGIMSAHRIGLPGTRHAFAGYHDSRLPAASAAAASLAVAGGCSPPTGPSGVHARAGRGD